MTLTTNWKPTTPLLIPIWCFMPILMVQCGRQLRIVGLQLGSSTICKPWCITHQTACRSMTPFPQSCHMWQSYHSAHHHQWTDHRFLNQAITLKSVYLLALKIDGLVSNITRGSVRFSTEVRDYQLVLITFKAAASLTACSYAISFKQAL